MRAPARLVAVEHFGSNPGALKAWAYVPRNLEPGSPLVVVLHGCRQTAADYDHGAGWSLMADRYRFAVLYPEQTRLNNAHLCFNWFEPGDTRRDAGEAFSIRQMIEQLAVARGIDRRRIFVTGLSAGGAMAMAMLASYPDVFSGGAVIAGLAYGTATTIPEAFDRMRGHGAPDRTALTALVRRASDYEGTWPRLSVWQGSDDPTVVPSNADVIIEQWTALHGLSPEPSDTETIDGHRRHVWHSHRGDDVIELYRVAGMGHGAPVHEDGIDGGDSSGPFMLAAGISATRRIATFWRLATSIEGKSVNHPRVAPHRPEHAAFRRPGIAAVIDKALRYAGLR